MTLHTMTM